MPARRNPSTTAPTPAGATRTEAWRRVPAWHLLPLPDPSLRLVVIVPVRNEAARLPATLAALADQRGLDGRRLDPCTFEIIVLANNCSDDSVGVVRRFAARHPRLRLHAVAVRFPRAVAHVGHARACLMNEASRRLQATVGAAGIIASTDGDTRVASDWLAAIRHEIDAGADAVGGRIVLESSAGVPPGLAKLARRDERYQRLRTQLEHAVDPAPFDPWPRHHQHFGANLAVSAAAYARVGGLPAEPFLEDEAFYQALCAHDMKVRHSESIRVVTSSRRDGRVAVGLSWQLREWEALAATRGDARVPDPRGLVRRVAAQAPAARLLAGSAPKRWPRHGSRAACAPLGQARARTGDRSAGRGFGHPPCRTSPMVGPSGRHHAHLRCRLGQHQRSVEHAGLHLRRHR